MATTIDVETPPTAPPPEIHTDTPTAQVNKPSTSTGGNNAVTTAVRNIWKGEDLYEKSTLVLRSLAWVFSFISLIVMASNKHGDWMDFDRYDEYRYLLAIGILAFLYSMGQVIRQVHRFTTGRDKVPKSMAKAVDFAGDQIVAYLLMSALSAAIPLTNHMREGSDNIFTDASAASISMAFFAFLAIALCALVSGFKLSKQTNI